MSTITRKPIANEQPFTVFANALLNDENLSAEVLGVLVYLLSKPGNWKVMPSQLAKRFGCGRDKIYRIMNDMIVAGYAERTSEREGGSFTEHSFLVSNEKRPLPENPDVAEPLPGKPTQQKKESTNQLDSRAAKKGEVPYSDDFEAIWQQYPRTKNTSKKDAWNIYRMLNSDRQEQVRRAVPVFAAAMRAEGRPDDKIKHMTSWLNGRMYETAAAPTSAKPTAGAAPQGPWYKTATREQWAKVLEKWEQLGRWSEAWGPEPGYGGCHVPPDLVAAHNLKYRSHLFRQAELDNFEKLVGSSMAVPSKHAVDISQPAVP